MNWNRFMLEQICFMMGRICTSTIVESGKKDNQKGEENRFRSRSRKWKGQIRFWNRNIMKDGGRKVRWKDMAKKSEMMGSFTEEVTVEDIKMDMEKQQVLIKISMQVGLRMVNDKVKATSLISIIISILDNGIIIRNMVKGVS